MLTIQTPEEYHSRPHLLPEAGHYLKTYGSRALIVGGPTALRAVGETFFQSLQNNGILFHTAEFTGYPTREAVNIYAQQAADWQADLLIGIGGGRVCDLVKAAGDCAGLPVAAVPTVAATCACWAACSILYRADGDFDTIVWNHHTTRLILADTALLVTAPPRYLYAGIVDTLAKWIETAPNLKISPEDLTLSLSVSGARIAYDVLTKYGRQAVRDGANGIITQKSVDTVDAVLYLAGFVGSIRGDRFYGGFAHPFYYATTRLPHTRHMLHGEKVAFGLLVQQTLEGQREEVFAETLHLLEQFELALTLEDMGIVAHPRKDAQTIAENILRDFPDCMAALGYGTSVREITDAILYTDARVRSLTTSYRRAGNSVG